MLEGDPSYEDTNIGRMTDPVVSTLPATIERNRPSLVLLTGLNAGQVFALDAAETLVGRGRACPVYIEDSSVSRQHARVVRRQDGGFDVEDLKSKNGTFLGGQKIGRAPLTPGDQVQFGFSMVYRFGIFDEQEERLARQLFESSTRDALTGAFNRKYFLARLQSEVAYAKRHRTDLAIILFDLDLFKKVNDTHGHLAGDEVLRRVSAQVARLIRTEDVFARYGGEEFTILVRGIDHYNVGLFAERIRRTVEKLNISWERTTLEPTISVGVGVLRECAEPQTGESLLLLSDDRLYRAKREGRNRVCRD